MKTILLLLFTAVSMAALAQDTTVVQLEYFFDSDNGVGNNTLVNVVPAADGTFPFTANIAGLSVGNHKLYIRTKDNLGRWSLTARRNVEVFTPDAKVTLVSGEYFIDSDPGFGNAMPATVTSPDSVILQNFTAATSSLSVGYHKLYGRLKDNLGRWSQTFRRNIEVYKNDTNYITKAEYFFKTDNGYGTGTTVLLSPPATDGTYSFNIPLSAIPKGADTLFVRVQDSSENKWSLTAFKNTSDTSHVLPLTLLAFNVVKQGTTAQLAWQTANEVNTSYFDIQRSGDGTQFTTIGKTSAKGNNGAKNTYSYSDDVSTIASGKLYYRLSMVDKDGAFSYSSIAYITIDNEPTQITVTPNPAHNYFVINKSANAEMSKAVIVVRDLQGRTLISQNCSNALQQRVDVSRLTKGVYLVSIITQNNTQTVKLLIE